MVHVTNGASKRSRVLFVVACCTQRVRHSYAQHHRAGKVGSLLSLYSRGYRVYCCSITCSVESSESKYDSFTFCSKSRKLEQSYLVKCRLYHVCNPCMFMIGSFPRIAHLNEPMLIQGCLY
jgi:hypothetical protein